MGFLKSFTSTVQKGLDQTVGELKPGGKAWEQRKGALGKWDPGKGWLGHATAQIYGGSTKSIFDTMQGKDSDYKEEDVPPPTLTGSQVDPDAEQGALQDIRKRKEGRLAANLAPASGASILTSR